MKANLENHFRTADTFVKHVEMTREYRVTKQKWNKALINTEIGINQTGTFRDFTVSFREEIALAGGHDAALQYKPNIINGELMWSKPVHSDILQALCIYNDTIYPY